MNPFRLAPASLAMGLAALASLIAGCAGGAASRPAGNASSSPAGAPPLATLRPSLHTLEDSLVLDVLLGYQEIAAGRSDRETLRRARSAQNQLDYMLRHGGVKDRGGEGRVIEIPEGEKASLGQLTAQMSRELLRSPTGETEAQRAREIRSHRPDLSALVEDAEWILALNAAMDGPLSEEDKRALRRLNESYSNRAPHATVAAQVQALLQTVKDDRLKKELKKLANRSWDRERRAQATATAPAAVPAAAPAPAIPEAVVPAAVTPAPVDSFAPLPDFDASSAPVATPLPDSAFKAPAPIAATSAPASTDSVSDATAGVSPDRYCDDRRADAASAFASSRSATGAARTALLKKSLAALDDCLRRYPDSKGAEKARGNRDRVQKELRP